MKKTVNILGIRGLPAAHGGFETFAGNLAPYLRDRGWTVNVYCQLEPDRDGRLPADFEDDWEGIHRIHIGSSRSSSLGSVIFDYHCVRDVLSRPGVDLVLGYNTAVFAILQRLRGRKVIMNMDGVEWKRDKWRLPVKAWFYVNELIGANVATVPIADHPEIARHLRRHGCSRAQVVPYGSSRIEDAPVAPLQPLGLLPRGYLVSIARIEPENSVLEIVRAFSSRPRRAKLVVLGRFDEANAYHRAVRNAAGPNVLFPGAIYDQTRVAALRFHAMAYLHGHQVGGTNPSLVEALGAGNAVIAHDNRFNRWVAGAEQFYFGNEPALEQLLTEADEGRLPLMEASRAASRQHGLRFTHALIHEQYERVLEEALQGPVRS